MTLRKISETIVSQVDFVFCAVNMKKEDIKALEETYARHECPVVSNNSAHRSTPDVPMIIPELNADHADVIAAQRARLGTKRGVYFRKMQLFPPELCASDSSFDGSGSHQSLGLYLPGNFWCG